MIRALLCSMLIIPISVQAETYKFNVKPLELPYSKETITGIEIDGPNAVIIHSNGQRSTTSGYCSSIEPPRVTCSVWPHVAINGKVLYSLRLTFEVDGTLILFDSQSKRMGITTIERSTK